MDKIEIVKRIKYIKESLDYLSLTLKKYRKVEDKQEKIMILKALERFCEEIIECATRINQEILSDSGEIAESYRQSFEKLDKFKLFDSKLFLDKLANTTGFRNRLAHDYIDLNVEITISSAEGILREYPKYILKILEYVNKK